MSPALSGRTFLSALSLAVARKVVGTSMEHAGAAMQGLDGVEIVQHFTRGQKAVVSLTVGFASGILPIVIGLTTATVLMVTHFHIGPTLVIIASIASFAIVTARFSGREKAAAARWLSSGLRVDGAIGLSVQLNEPLLFFGARGAFLDRFAVQAEHNHRLGRMLATVGLQKNLLLNAIQWLGIAAAIHVSIFDSVVNSPGKLVTMLLIFIYMLAPVAMLVSITGNLILAAEKLRPLADFVKNRAVVTGRPRRQSWQSPIHSLTVERPMTELNGRMVTSQVALTVRRGNRIALTGPSGCGKTTLGRLISNFYRLQGGVLALNGVKLPSDVLWDFEGRVVTVPQEQFIFEGSLKDNITLFDDSISDADVVDACARLSIDRMIDTGFSLSWPVAQGGTNLSGGQRQRVSLARALVRRPDILILDEPTQGLGSAAAHEVMSAIFSQFRDAAILVVTHDKLVVDMADREVVVAVSTAQ
jgi:ABC-type bacteriocin/lantibiotic exporter with double-glycine peptidase domain